MKLLQFIHDDQPRLGIQTESGILDVQKHATALALNAPSSMEELIAGGEAAMLQLEELLRHPGQVQLLQESEITYAPCLTHPDKIICVGLNYVSHAEESNMSVPATPVLFSKFNNSLAAHRQSVKLPSSAVQFDYEAELVLVIGKEASNVPKEEALSHVFGYMAGNDLSARDLQFRTGQWLLGKSLDHFAPVGPYLVTADEIDPGNLKIECKVNGVVCQSGNTRDMIFDCASIISYISQYIRLKPGDLIFTGTPEGVILGLPEEQRKWLKSGDRITVSIDRLGSLETTLL